MRKYMCLLISLVIILLAACSESGRKTSLIVAKPGQSQEILQKNKAIKTTERQANGTEKLCIWSFYDLGTEVHDMIRESLPHVAVDYKVINSIESSQMYTTAYNEGKLPDVFILEPLMMGNYNSTNAFIDLKDSPYNAETMISSYPDNLKSFLHSLDGKKLLTLPVELVPGVTFYRYDVMKASGLPSEPEELAVYMENTNNWLHMAKTLKRKSQYMINTSSDTVFYADLSSDWFDEQLNFTRNAEIFTKMLELLRNIDTLGLASNANLMDAKEGNTIQNGKTVMFISSLLYSNYLKEVAKGTAYGQWRMTRLPFGLYNWLGSAVAAIPSESNNKDAAWTVVKLLANRHLSTMSKVMNPDGNTKVYNNRLFGDQDIDKLYRMLIERMPEYKLTPLDEKARIAWMNQWYKEFDDLSTPPSTLINRWSQNVQQQLGKDIEALKPYLKN